MVFNHYVDPDFILGETGYDGPASDDDCESASTVSSFESLRAGLARVVERNFEDDVLLMSDADQNNPTDLEAPPSTATSTASSIVPNANPATTTETFLTPFTSSTEFAPVPHSSAKQTIKSITTEEKAETLEDLHDYGAEEASPRKLENAEDCMTRLSLTPGKQSDLRGSFGATLDGVEDLEKKLVDLLTSIPNTTLKLSAWQPQFETMMMKIQSLKNELAQIKTRHCGLKLSAWDLNVHKVRYAAMAKGLSEDLETWKLKFDAVASELAAPNDSSQQAELRKKECCQTLERTSVTNVNKLPEQAVGQTNSLSVSDGSIGSVVTKSFKNSKQTKYTTRCIARLQAEQGSLRKPDWAKIEFLTATAKRPIEEFQEVRSEMTRLCESKTASEQLPKSSDEHKPEQSIKLGHDDQEYLAMKSIGLEPRTMMNYLDQLVNSDIENTFRKIRAVLKYGTLNFPTFQELQEYLVDLEEEIHEHRSPLRNIKDEIELRNASGEGNFDSTPLPPTFERTRRLSADVRKSLLTEKLLFNDVEKFRLPSKMTREQWEFYQKNMGGNLTWAMKKVLKQTHEVLKDVEIILTHENHLELQFLLPAPTF